MNFKESLNWRRSRVGRSSVCVRGRESRERSHPAGYRRMAVRREFEPTVQVVRSLDTTEVPRAKGHLSRSRPMRERVVV